MPTTPAQPPPGAPGLALPRALTGTPALAALVLGYAALYSALSWLRLRNFHAQIDMSFYVRLIWGLGQGRVDHPLVQARHFLGLHLEPVLFPLAALSALGVPLGPLLVVLQAVAVALLAWPAYRLAARALPPGVAQGRAPLLFAALALLYPTVTVQTLFDFHPVTLALAPLLGVVDALHQGRLRRALGLALLALACREDIALQLALLFFAIPAGGPRRGLAISLVLRAVLPLLLVAYFLVYVLLIQPPRLPGMGSYGLHFPRIAGAAVHSGPQLLRAALAHPAELLRYLVSGDRPLYPARLLWPLGFLSLLAPRPLLAALPIVGINLLSDFPRVRALESHYTTAIAPLVIASAILGSGRLLRAWTLPRLRGPLLAAVGLIALAAHGLHGASPWALRSPRWAGMGIRATPRRAELDAARAAVPPGASVAAPPGLLARLAERPRIQSPPEYDDGHPVDVRLTLTP